MKFVETEAKNVEEAIQKACELLQASREDLDVEILENGSSGFLGIGARKARIRATRKEGAPVSGKEAVSARPGRQKLGSPGRPKRLYGAFSIISRSKPRWK